MEPCGWSRFKTMGQERKYRADEAKLYTLYLKSRPNRPALPRLWMQKS
jgi:hypothetical protein